MTLDDIDTWPDGVVLLDRGGFVRGYNAAEARLSRRTIDATVGRHFFDDVAPCTKVREFKGAFDTFAASDEAESTPFAFNFRFPWGTAEVHIHFVRIAGFDGAAAVVEQRYVADTANAPAVAH